MPGELGGADAALAQKSALSRRQLHGGFAGDLAVMVIVVVVRGALGGMIVRGLSREPPVACGTAVGLIGMWRVRRGHRAGCRAVSAGGRVVRRITRVLVAATPARRLSSRSNRSRAAASGRSARSR